MLKKIMVVDDEPDLVKLLAHHLKREGFEPVCMLSGEEALQRITRLQVSLVILDLMMPGLDGLQVCKQIRGRPETATLPIIMVTAKDDESDKIIGLELGADDYITKPFSVKELIARVRSLLRRSAQQEPQEIPSISYGGLTLDVMRHEVKSAGEKITLTSKEFSLLKYFLQNKGRILTREALLNSVWVGATAVNTRTIDVHIRRLRKKIPFLSVAIETVPALGYRLSDAI